MALHRGIQSAIFYYLSCAPCADARYRKKRKQEAVRGRAEREALQAEMPDAYHHPSPSSTNPYWQSEIAAGPTLVARGRKKGNATGSAKDVRRGLKTSATNRTVGSQTPSSTNLSQRDVSSRDGRVDSKWHIQQFQREDEPYINLSRERLASSSTLDGSASGLSGITRPAKAKTRFGDGYLDPEVNDRHPAVVTTIHSKEEAQWLMAPPPTAEFMSGKDRSSRSRSDSGGSRLSVRSGIPLSREVSRRIMEHKIRHGEGPRTPPLSREGTLQPTSNPSGQRHDRRTTDERDFALDGSPKQRSAALQPGLSEDSGNSARTVIRNPDLAPQPARARKVASRPQLSTIASDNSVAADENDFYTPLEAPVNPFPRKDPHPTARDRLSRRSPLLVRDDSLKVLQGVDPALRTFKSEVFTSKDFATSPRPAQTRFPMQDGTEESDPEPLYDSWYTPDFQLPEWIHEHTKRKVTKRWSMDI